ncbi:MAG: glutamate--tRNA ligase [Planctomycetes bacterium]|nr:glutamate--tRNA ligase [Planctomycetota bacterium]
MTARPRLRFAPSPTGPLHLGGARTALYNWAAARAMGGTFLLRIEDTDQARSSEQSLRIILEALRWLGIDWDEGPERGGDHGPYLQTERLDIYRRYADRLVAAGHAYECFATAEEVEEGRQRLQAAGERPMYDRRHRDLSDAERDALRRERGPGSLRFRMPLDQVQVLPDLSKGDVSINLAELDDWVMVRPDGMPTYNFACVVDDLEMGITHVVRGEEHLMNGFKQAVLFERLGAEPPRYAHIPLILGAGGKKLSKREASVDVLEYRDKGYLPEAVFNYITLLGWSFSGDRDVFTKAEMLERFRIEDIGTKGSRFDDAKLRWMSGDYLRRLSADELVERVRPFVHGVVPDAAFETQPGLVRNAVRCYQERAELLAEFAEKLGWLFADRVEPDDDARKKLAKSPDAPRWLADYAALLETSALPPSWPDDRTAADAFFELPSSADRPAPAGTAPCLGPRELEARCRAFAEERGIPFGQLVHPVRAALTGTTKGPGLFDVVFLLGRRVAVERLRALAGGSAQPA